MGCHAVHLIQFDIDYDKALLIRLCLNSYQESLVLKGFENGFLKAVDRYNLSVVGSLLYALDNVEADSADFTLSLDSHEHALLEEAVRMEIEGCKLDTLESKLEMLLEYLCA